MSGKDETPNSTSRKNSKRVAEGNLLSDALNKTLSRRAALSTMGKAAIGVAAVAVVGGAGGYYYLTESSASSSPKQVSLLTQAESLNDALLKIDASSSQSAIGITLNVTEEPFTQMAPTLTAMTASNNIPYDVVSIAHDQAGPYVPYFRSLDDLIEKNNTDLSVFTPALVNQLYKRDKTTGRFGQGNQLGIPYISAPWGLQYNTKMFVDAGLVDSTGKAMLPDTWDKFTEYMTTLTTGQVYGLAASYSVWWNPAWMHVSYVATNGGTILDSSYRPLINDSNNVASVQYWADAVNVHKFVQPAALTTDDAGLTGLFNSAGAASYIYWFTGTLPSANDPIQSSVVGQAAAGPLPNGGKVPAGGWAHWMPQTETNADAAFKYMMWESTNEVQAALNSGDLSFVRTASFSDPSIIAKYPYAADIGTIAAAGYAEPSFDIKEGSQLWTTWLPHFQDVVSGNATAQAAMDACYTEWDTILKGAGYYT